jgi:hypothetical protein
MLPWIAVVMEGQSSPIGSRPAMVFRYKSGSPSPMLSKKA